MRQVIGSEKIMTRNILMHIFSLSIFILIVFILRSAADQNTSLLIDREIAKHKAEIIKIRRFLHMNPELSNQEFETANLIASKLLSLGLEVKTGIAKTGVTGLLRGEMQGLTIGIRADMDALPIQEITDVPFKSLNPGVMHACGHDIHMAIALGTAMVMDALKDRINGNIKFIFQPAEEGGPWEETGGAERMIQEGVLEAPSVKAIFGLHVWPEEVGQVLFSSGPIMASSDWFKITIQGKSSHAAMPHQGIDAISLASQVIVSLQSIVSRAVDPTDPAVVTIGKIEGGTKSNIIAEKVVIEGTIRTLSETNRVKIPRLIEDLVRGLTDTFDANYLFDYNKGAPPLYNHPDLASILLPSLTRVLGESNVKQVKPQMIAEDFSYYCQKIPGFYFLLGVKSPENSSLAPLHSPFFNPDERSIPIGIKIMCHLLIQCFEHQRHIGEMPR
jgi:amidohydrolase